MSNIEIEEEPRIIPAISVVVLNENNKILLVRRTPQRTYNPGAYDLIGGDILPGEIPIDTLKRDVKKKLGVEISETGVESRGTVDIRVPEGIIRRNLFICQIASETPITLDPKKYDKSDWYDAAQIEQLSLTPGVEEILITVGFLTK